MSELLSLVIDYQKNANDLVFNKISKIFKKTIELELYDVKSFYRDDLYQEILMKINKIVLEFKIKKHLDFDKNEAELLKYIKKSIFTSKCDFLKNKSMDFQESLIRLNQVNEKGIELLETIMYEENLDSSKKYFDLLEEKDKEFLMLFIDDDQILTQKSVAKKLGISQQAVNKRKKQIINKIIN